MKYIVHILASICAFFLPVQGLLLAVAIAIALDTFTGIFKAVKLTGWHSLTSRRLSDIAAKFVLYNCALISIFCIEHYLLAEFLQIWFSVQYIFTKLVAFLLVIIELTSIKENFEEAFSINLWAMLKNAMRRSQEIKNDFNELTK